MMPSHLNKSKTYRQKVIFAISIIICSIISIKINKPPSYLILLSFFIIFMIFNVVSFIINNVSELSFSRILYLIITILGIMFVLYNIYMYHLTSIEFDKIKKERKNKQSFDYKKSVKITDKVSTKTKMVE